MRATGVAVDGSGNVCVADCANHCIQRFNVPSIGGTSDIVDVDLASGAINNAGTAHSLNSQLDNAQALLNQGDIQGTISALNAFIQHVEAQSGKHIEVQAAQLLINDAQVIMNSLQK